MKNAYDADSPSCYILFDGGNEHFSDIYIIDFGGGMDIPTINDCWMQIGTDNKQQNIETANGRIKSGAKGIGRFALNRLGSKAIMYTHKDGQDAFFWKVGTPLFEFCQTRHGIATLSNKTYIFLPNKEDDKYYYLEKEDVSYPIEKTLCKDIVNSNKLNSEKALVNHIRLYFLM